MAAAFRSAVRPTVRVPSAVIRVHFVFHGTMGAPFTARRFVQQTNCSCTVRGFPSMKQANNSTVCLVSVSKCDYQSVHCVAGG